MSRILLVALIASFALFQAQPGFAQVECLFGLCGDLDDEDVDVGECPGGTSDRSVARTGQELYNAEQFPLTAGGTLNLSGCLSAPGSGFLANLPDLSLTYERDSARDLRFRASGGCDLTLLVNDPSTNWTFSDDANGQNPEVRLSNPGSGRYDVWVGTIGPSNCAATLEIESFVLTAGGDSSASSNLNEPSAACPSAASSGRTLDLSASALRLGRSMAVTAGGVIPLSTCEEIDGLGYAHPSPDYSLSYDPAVMGDLRVAATSDCDTFLLANDPSESWHYNDDIRGHDPELVLRDIPAGRLDFWIGTLSQEDCPAELTFTSLSGGSPTAAKSKKPTARACPSEDTAGESLDLASADLYSAKLYKASAGGSIDLSACEAVTGSGYIASAPTYSLNFVQSGGHDLKLRVRGVCDTVLLVNDFHRAWHFSDDAVERDPQIVLPTPETGRIDIWVGSIGAESCKAKLELETF